MHLGEATLCTWEVCLEYFRALNTGVYIICKDLLQYKNIECCETNSYRNSLSNSVKMTLAYFVILVALSSVVICTYGIDAGVVDTTSGRSCYLRFDYTGPRSRVRYYFTKNGRLFRADRRRVFYRLGRIYFSKVTESDAGTYRLVVRGYGVTYTKEIILNGTFTEYFELEHFIMIMICLSLVLAIVHDAPEDNEPEDDATGKFTLHNMPYCTL